MEKLKFLAQIERLEKTYGKKVENIELWYAKFNELSDEKFKELVDDLIASCKWQPTLAEALTHKEDTGNINWNSCYWFEIEREYCETHKIPYYDITTGKPLPPYKN